MGQSGQGASLKDTVRMRTLFVRRASPLSVPSHIQVQTRPGRPLIREYSWRLNRRARVVLNTVNLLGWTLWLILFGLILTALAWSAGVWFVQREWVEADGIRGLGQFVQNDLPVGISICLIFLAWSTVRVLVIRRQKVARRRAERAMSDQWSEGSLTKFEQAHEALLRAKQVQCLICHHDASGVLITVDPVNLTVAPTGSSAGLRDRVVTKTR